MSEIRQKILEQMRRQGLTKYAVWKLVESDIPRRTVYSFLSGEKDAGTKKASIIMKAVGLKITTTKPKAKKKKRR
jgi:hypothetical protein